MLTPLNYFEWKAEMVIQLRSKGLYRVTMGIKNDKNSAMEKAKYLNRLDEAFGMLFHISHIHHHLRYEAEALKPISQQPVS